MWRGDGKQAGAIGWNFARKCDLIAGVSTPRDLIDLCCKDEIVGGQSTGFVSPDIQRHFVVVNMDIGMMALLLAKPGDPVDPIDRTQKLIELEGLGEVVVLHDSPAVPKVGR